MTLHQNAGAHLAGTAAGQIAECEFHAGSRVTHSRIGFGEVVFVQRRENPMGRVVFTARVRFDDGTVRNLRLPNRYLRFDRSD